MKWKYLWAVVGLAALLNGVRLRIRARSLSVVETRSARRDDAGSLDGSNLSHPLHPTGVHQTDFNDDDHTGWKWLAAGGVELSQESKDDLTAYADSNGIAVIDVVPASLGVEQALELLRSGNPKTYLQSCLAPAVTALHAIGLRADVGRRAGIEEATGLSATEMWQAATRLKRYAPRASQVAVIEAVGSVASGSEERYMYLRARFGPAVAAVLGIPLVLYIFLGVGVVIYPFWGLIAVVAWSLQPLVALFGTPLHPRDLWKRSLLRSIMGPADQLSMMIRAGGSRELSRGSIDTLDERRALYDELLSQGTHHFFEPVRTDCPMCASELLSELFTTTDLIQQKPGLFTLVKCESCGHIFQNPRLSLEGLDFYYRDFYDGMGEDQLEFVFGATDSAYRGRANMLQSYAHPTRWLDVGCGHGHFCLVANEIWPDTRFDGLDMSESVEEAEKRGWVEKGFRGLLLDLAPQLKGEYDVVSMHHYLEHTREPLKELDAAISALCPGGHLLIELPDPESTWKSVLGRYWIPWFQPQHQHLISFSNLVKLLEGRKMTVVKTMRGESVQPVDLTFAVWFLVNQTAPSPNLPWRHRRGRMSLYRRLIVVALASPFLLLALLLDNVLAVFTRAGSRSNTYRILARSPLPD